MALFVLLSGDALWIGLGLVAVGALVGTARPGLSVPVASIGLVIALAAAVPLHGIVYLGLVLAFAGWVACISRPHLARLASGVLLFAAVVVVSVAVVTQRPAKPNVPAGQRPVYVLGDSLSAGLGTSEAGAWPTLLAERIQRPVRSFARPGAVLSDGLRQAEALPSTDCVVVIELGGNDLLSGTTAEAFATSLRQLLQHVARSDRSILMFELPLLPLQNRLGRAQQQVSAEFGVRLIPRRVLAGAVSLPGHTTDGLHLSAEGHRWLAGKVAEWL